MLSPGPTPMPSKLARRAVSLGSTGQNCSSRLITLKNCSEVFIWRWRNGWDPRNRRRGGRSGLTQERGKWLRFVPGLDVLHFVEVGGVK